MAYLPGGHADKKGNRFEVLWVIEQFLRLLDERIETISFEGVGLDAVGVDVWIRYTDGTREACQCKGRNGPAEKWTIGALDNCGVLKALAAQLLRDESARFRLVTGVPFTALNDMCRQLEEAGENAGALVNAFSSKKRSLFEAFCRRSELDPVSDRATAIDILRRFTVTTKNDEETWATELDDRAHRLVRGKTSDVIASLRELAETNLGRKWTSTSLWKALEDRGFEQRSLGKDDRIRPAVQRLYTEYADSVAGRLIDSALIPRPEVDRVLELAQQYPVVVVHGAAGTGKTGVLFGVLKNAEETGVPVLPVSLDQRDPSGSPQKFGDDLGLVDSPSYCLASVAGDGPALLILDQLDSLLAKQKGGSAIGVLRSLFREVQAIRRDGGQISVVVACRTFDLEYNPEIRSWLRPDNDTRRAEVRVGQLPGETVAAVTRRHGFTLEKLPQEQQRLLTNPLNLYLWTQICRSSPAPPFLTATQLMDRFWEWVTKQLPEGVGEECLLSTLGELRTYCEKWDQWTVPARCVTNRAALRSLQSCGAVVKDGAGVRFVHQGYLDYWIARGALNEMGGTYESLLNWMGPKKRQTLRRHQAFRYVLAMLADENPRMFATQLRGILDAESVRFHYKELALRLTGTLIDPQQSILDLAWEYLAAPKWRTHFLGAVYYGHPAFLRDLFERGFLEDGLREDADEANWREALWLLRVGIDSCAEISVPILRRIASHSEKWRERINAHFVLDAVDCTDTVFELIIDMAGRGTLPQYVEWEKLSAKYPQRTVRLVGAVCRSWPAASDDSSDSALPEDNAAYRLCQHDNGLSGSQVAAMEKAARQKPHLAWQILLPEVVRCVDGSGDDLYSLTQWLGPITVRIRPHTEKPRRVVVLSLIAAGQILAEQDSMEYWAKTTQLRDSTNPVLEQVLVETYRNLSPEYADKALNWFTENSRRVAVGSGYGEAKWMPARRLIESLSEHCSNSVLARLQTFILDYHEDNERDRAARCLQTARKGYFHHYHGRAQYFLLPALAEHRRSVRCKEEIGVLQRKFGHVPEEQFLDGGQVTGGTVVSTVEPKKHQLHDKNWLDIISSIAVPESATGCWKQLDSDRVTESSVDHFARSLGNAAEAEPERFARLALRFPPNVHDAYVAAVLGALERKTPAEGVPDELKGTWQRAGDETIIQVMRKFGNRDARDVAWRFCSLIKLHAELPWPEDILNRLAWLAQNHPEPEDVAQPNVYSDKSAANASVHVLLNNTLNMVRASALLAIGAVLFEHPKHLSLLRESVEAASHDPHAAVRMASVEPLLAMLSMGGEQASAATKEFATLADTDLRIPAYPRAAYFFNLRIEEDYELLSPVLIDMAHSETEEIAQAGATGIAWHWMYKELFPKQIEPLLTGTAAQRRGICEAAVDHFGAELTKSRARELLLWLLDDDDDKVRDKIASIFGGKGASTALADTEFCQAYVRSTAFRANQFHLMRAMAEQGDIWPSRQLLLDIGCALVSPLGKENEEAGTKRPEYQVSRFLPLLRRLYERACEVRDDKILQSCLDHVDALAEAQVGWLSVMETSK